MKWRRFPDNLNLLLVLLVAVILIVVNFINSFQNIFDNDERNKELVNTLDFFENDLNIFEIYSNVETTISHDRAFYVDASKGNDSNDGTSPEKPWKTIVKVNSELNKGVIIKGDDILFKRGENFTIPSRLYPRIGGYFNNPMIFGAYGEGPKPILCNNLSESNGKTIQGYYMENTSYYIFQDLNISGCDDEGISLCSLGVNNITIRRVSFYNIGGYGVILQHVDNFKIENCDAKNIKYSAFLAYGSPSDHTRNGKFWNLTINNCGFDGIVFHYQLEHKDFVGPNHWIENVTISGCGEAGIDVSFGSNPKANLYVHNVEITDCDQGGIVSGHHTRYETYDSIYIHDINNFLFGNTYDCNVILRNSVLENWGKLATVISQNQDGYFCSNVAYYNNLFISNGKKDYVKIIESSNGKTKNLSFKNNIFFSKVNNLPDRFIFYTDTGYNFSSTNSTWSNNLYWRGEQESRQDVTWWYTPEDEYLSYDQWLSYNKVTNEFVLDPHFENINSSNYLLKYNSPCIDAGDWLTFTIGSGKGDHIIVENSNYFMDGYDIDGLKGDEISIGNNLPVRIIDIIYEKNIIVVNRSVSWDQNDSVTLISGNTNQWPFFVDTDNSIIGKPDIGPNEYMPDHNLFNNLIDTSGKIRIYSDSSFRYLSSPLGGTKSTLSIMSKNVSPNYYMHLIDIEFLKWNFTSNFSIKWKEFSGDYNGSLKYSTSDLLGHNVAILRIDGVAIKDLYANPDGTFSFTLPTPIETRIIEIVPLGQPVIIDDASDKVGYTGDELLFDVILFDDKKINCVWIEYYYGAESIRENISLNCKSKQGLYYNFNYIIVINKNSLDPLFYITHACDSDDNWVSSKIKMIPIVDNDNPIFLNDWTPLNVDKNSNIIFSIKAYDNIKIDLITLKYWYNGNELVEFTINNNTFFEMTIDIPNENIDEFYYSFMVLDTSGNVNITDEKTILITKREILFEGKDNTPSYAYNGQYLNFNVSLTKFEMIKSLILEYWFDEINKIRVNMEYYDGKYIFKIFIPVDIKGNLYYMVYVQRLNNTVDILTQNNILILDNQLPVISFDPDNDMTIFHNEYKFDIFAMDNIGLGQILFEYFYNDNIRESLEMKNNTDHYTITIHPNGNMLYFQFIAYDLSGNMATSPIYSISLLKSNESEDGIIEKIIVNELEIGHIELALSNKSCLINQRIMINLLIYDSNNNLISNDIFKINWNILKGKGTLDNNGVFYTLEPTESLIQVNIIYNNTSYSSETWIKVTENNELLKNNNLIDMHFSWLFILISIIISIFVLILLLYLRKNYVSDLKIFQGIEIIEDDISNIQLYINKMDINNSEFDKDSIEVIDNYQEVNNDVIYNIDEIIDQILILTESIVNDKKNLGVCQRINHLRPLYDT